MDKTLVGGVAPALIEGNAGRYIDYYFEVTLVAHLLAEVFGRVNDNRHVSIAKEEVEIFNLSRAEAPPHSWP